MKMGMGIVHGHGHGHVYGHVHGHVYGHVYGGVHARVAWARLAVAAEAQLALRPRDHAAAVRVVPAHEASCGHAERRQKIKDHVFRQLSTTVTTDDTHSDPTQKQSPA